MNAQSKVPEPSLYFWVIKVLCTTVGETVADFLNQSLNLGLTRTSLIMTAVLFAALWLQFRARRYEPAIYWIAVVLVSIVGTLITDALTDVFDVPLETSSAVFGLGLVATFALWHASEQTLSIRTIVTPRREAFYWLAVLVTFALGTALGDLAAESVDLGYATAGVLFGSLISIVAAVHLSSGRGAVLCFWLAYILTRPMGAALGDYLSQAPEEGGLGLGTSLTSGVFLGVIVAMVTYLSVTRRDVVTTPERAVHP